MSGKPEIKVDTTARVRAWISVDDLKNESTVNLVEYAGNCEREVLIAQLWDCTLSALARREDHRLKIDLDLSPSDVEGLAMMADHLIEQYNESIIKVYHDQYSKCCGKQIAVHGDKSLTCEECGDETQAVVYE